jgi:hypothetical protein
MWLPIDMRTDEVLDVNGATSALWVMRDLRDDFSVDRDAVDFAGDEGT